MPTRESKSTDTNNKLIPLGIILVYSVVVVWISWNLWEGIQSHNREDRNDGVFCGPGEVQGEPGEGGVVMGVTCKKTNL